MMTALASLWAWLQRLGAPAPVADVPLTPVAPPRLSQEEFSDGIQAVTKVQQERQETLYQRLVATNNAYVYRDYGNGPVVEHDDKTVTALTADETRELAAFELEPQRRPGRHAS